MEAVCILEETVYLDNSATTKPCAGAVERMTRALRENWGNPSSLHTLGMNASVAVEDARAAVSKLIHCREDEIFFTSGGTESNNTAIIGAAKAREKRGKRIVTTSIEHPSVLETVKRLESEGFETVYLKPDRSGCISDSDIYSAVTPDTVLVSIMLVNNETGAIQPVKTAADAIKRANSPALLHCDAVQAFGKMPINVTSLGVDMLTASGHKIHAPKGIGFLYLKKGVGIKPLITGGGQERGLRSGTEAVPLICGLHGAVEELPNIADSLEKQQKLRDYAAEALEKTGLVTVNSAQDSLPYVLNISVLGYRSEVLLHFLESRGIYVSSGSACAKGEGSFVLKEMGFDAKTVDSALRISFSRYNTFEDVDRLVLGIKDAAAILRKVK